MTREDLEGLLGEKVDDWQWERVVEVLIKKQKPKLRKGAMDRPHRPDPLKLFQKDVQNVEVYEQELDAANSILRRNRYNTKEPYEWFGPDPEPEHEVNL
jgi:hypothetical protein